MAEKPQSQANSILQYGQALGVPRNGQSLAPIEVSEDLDWPGLNKRLKNALSYQTGVAALSSLGNGNNGNSDGDPHGYAALITALSNALSRGDDGKSELSELRQYIQNAQAEALRDEVSEIRQALTQGGNPTLETIIALKEIGAIGQQNQAPQGNPTLETIMALKELGIIGQPPPQQKSPMSAVQETMAMIEVLRDMFQPASTVQFSDGQMPMRDFLAFKEIELKREEMLHEQRLQEKRLDAGKSALGDIAAAFSGLAKRLEDEEPPARSASEARRHSLPPQQQRSTPAVAPVQQQSYEREDPGEDPEPDTDDYSYGPVMRVPSNAYNVDVPCDHCGEAVAVDISTRPDSFECEACGQTSQVIYGES